MLSLPAIPGVVMDRPEWTAPAPEWEDWIRAEFLSERGAIHCEDHAHLEVATLGVLLTSADQVKSGMRTLGTCGLGEPTGKPWTVAQRRQQLVEWFGDVPDFVITLDAVWLSVAQPLQACALVDHELYHASFETDRYGGCKRDKAGRPIWGVKPHDVEEHVGVVRRWGAWSDGLKAMKEALDAGPRFTIDALGGVCGCGARL